MSIVSEETLSAPPRFSALFPRPVGTLAPSIWLITIFAVLLDAAIIHFTGLRLAGVTMAYLILMGPVVLGPLILAYVLYRNTGYRKAALAAEAYGILMCLLLVGETLSYAATTANFPLYDAYALAADRALGFDWLSTMRALDSHGTAIRLLHFAYRSIWLQGFVVLIVLSYQMKIREIENFLFAFIGCYVATLLISIVFPMLGVLTQFPGVTFQNLNFHGGATDIPFAIALRNGSLHTIDMQDLQGLITMPSFHAVMAVLWIYAAWRTGLLLWIILPLNILMLFSTLTEGGHYLCDVLAGMGLAVAVIGVVEYRRGIRPSVSAAVPYAPSTSTSPSEP